VTVVAGSDNGVITGALVKESSGTIVAEGDPLPNVLQGYNETPITVSLDSNLPSGTYWLFISVEGGGSFRSPSFTIP